MKSAESRPRLLAQRLLRRLGNAMFSSVATANEERHAQLNARLDEFERKLFSVMTEQIAHQRQVVEERSDLAEFAYSAFSQFGEDGILFELLRRIPALNRSFVEFGVEDYTEANTRLLAELGTWRGLVMDSSDANVDFIRKRPLYWRTDLTALSAFVTAANVNSLIQGAGFEGDVGVLSIDIDGNDYWVWREVEVIDPAIVICEYNSIFGRNHAITIPYNADFSRSKAHYSNLYFGASLLALSHLAAGKGYELVAVEPMGVNAFFVRNAAAVGIESVDPIDAYRLTPVRESLDTSGEHSYLSGRRRLEEIQDLPVVCLPGGEQRRLGDLDIEY